VHDEKAVKQDGDINLQREGELDLFLFVRYTYDSITSVPWLAVTRKLTLIGCNEEAYTMSIIEHDECQCMQTAYASASRLRPW